LRLKRTRKCASGYKTQKSSPQIVQNGAPPPLLQTFAEGSIEFEDHLDHERKYCQLKAGPNTINKDDVETIAGHFRAVIQLGRTNNLRLGFENLVVGVLYGESGDLSSHYKRITRDYHYPVLAGKEFWYRLTGDEDFYADLIKCIGEVARDANFMQELDDIVEKLSRTPEIIALSNDVSIG